MRGARADRDRPVGVVRGRGSVAVEQRGGQDGGASTAESALTGLHTAVCRLRLELAGYPADLRDRAVAEEELAVLDAMVRSGSPDVLRLRRSLLLVASALGSVSALAPALAEMREAIDRFGGASARGRN
ncbi:DUF5955 family protein [Streptomyces sp. TP-A0874]|uniref:DUF5955 family protein n=1 Tax=Streptomyces sp. TP-A0874 TaxID=549819 RepID=UPI001FCCE820|nr:DUF5955 family protein [Streptomyces sp. TP-A0874]